MSKERIHKILLFANDKHKSNKKKSYIEEKVKIICTQKRISSEIHGKRVKGYKQEAHSIDTARRNMCFFTTEHYLSNGAQHSFFLVFPNFTFLFLPLARF